MWHGNFTVQPTDSARLPSTTTRTLHLYYLMFLSHFIVLDEKWKAKNYSPTSFPMKVVGRFYSIISLLTIFHIFHIPWLLIWYIHCLNHCLSNVLHICITSKVNFFCRNIVNTLIFTHGYFHFYLFSLQKC